MYYLHTVHVVIRRLINKRYCDFINNVHCVALCTALIRMQSKPEQSISKNAYLALDKGKDERRMHCLRGWLAVHGGGLPGGNVQHRGGGVSV